LITAPESVTSLPG